MEKNLTVSEEGDSEDESSTPSRNEEMTTRPQLPGSGGTSEPRQRRGPSWFNNEETPKKEKKAKKEKKDKKDKKIRVIEDVKEDEKIEEPKNPAGR